MQTRTESPSALIEAGAEAIRIDHLCYNDKSTNRWCYKDAKYDSKSEDTQDVTPDPVALVAAILGDKQFGPVFGETAPYRVRATSWSTHVVPSCFGLRGSLIASQ